MDVVVNSKTWRIYYILLQNLQIGLLILLDLRTMNLNI